MLAWNRAHAEVVRLSRPCDRDRKLARKAVGHFHRLHQRCRHEAGRRAHMALGSVYLAEVFGLSRSSGVRSRPDSRSVLLRPLRRTRIRPGAARGSLPELHGRGGRNRKIARHRHSHIDDLVGTLNLVFVPLFFVHTGMQINRVAAAADLYLAAIVISAGAFSGRSTPSSPPRSTSTTNCSWRVDDPARRGGPVFAATGQALASQREEF